MDKEEQAKMVRAKLVNKDCWCCFRPIKTGAYCSQRCEDTYKQKHPLAASLVEKELQQNKAGGLTETP